MQWMQTHTHPHTKSYIDGLLQDCSISIALAMEILQYLCRYMARPLGYNELMQ